MHGSDASATTIHVGTYTNAASDAADKAASHGIYHLTFDAETGALGETELAAEAVNPAFLAWHPHMPVLYSVSETAGAGGPDGNGAVLAFAAAADGSLRRMNAVPSGGAGPCYVSVNDAGTHLFAANYHGGSVAAFPIGADGRIGLLSSLVRHGGASVHPVRQRKPYAHAILPAPGGAFVLAADLGIDRVIVYRFDSARGLLTQEQPGTVAAAAPGSGPRHLAFTPDGAMLFVINELTSTIAAYAWDGARGMLTRRGDPVSMLPADFAGENIAAEIAVHPNGTFVYAANRGHDSIAIFRIVAESGADGSADRSAHGSAGSLTRVGLHATGGRTPRHFAIAPDGRFLLAANQDSDSIAVFRIDGRTGLLSDTAIRARVPSPACIRFRSRP